MPITRSTFVNQQTAYDVQHWLCCVVLAEKRQVRVHFLGLRRRNYESSPHIQQVHKKLRLLCKYKITRPMLHIISGLLVHFCTPDDGHNNTRNIF
jgi:hypothetical protein